jgi:hypothetical protein
MTDINIIWKSLCWRDADLLTLARRAGEIHRFLEVARRHDLLWEEYLDRQDRDFGVMVPTERLEAFVTDLRARRIPFGTIDCGNAEALRLCQMLGLDAELLEAVPARA